MNTTSVPWYTSKVIWMAVLSTVLPLAAFAFHMHVTSDQVGQIAEALAEGGTAVSSLLVIYYRLQAAHPITGTTVAAAVQATPVTAAVAKVQDLPAQNLASVAKGA